jgi:ABC-type Mn2+/Zn2+ transport system ATPase subunit
MKNSTTKKTLTIKKTLTKKKESIKKKKNQQEVSNVPTTTQVTASLPLTVAKPVDPLMEDPVTTQRRTSSRLKAMYSLGLFSAKMEHDGDDFFHIVTPDGVAHYFDPNGDEIKGVK